MAADVAARRDDPGLRTAGAVRDPAEEAERLARITAEIDDAVTALAGLGPAVAVFGSARTPAGEPSYEVARETARQLGQDGHAVITGGGPGLMEAANLGAVQAGATSVGLTIDLPLEEEPNAYLDLRVHLRYFFVRRLMFVRHASAFVVHPGGFGTLDEMFEALALIQNRKIERFPVVLVGRSHWAGLIDWLGDHLAGGGLIDPADLDQLHVVDRPAEAAAAIRSGLRPAPPG